MKPERGKSGGEDLADAVGKRERRMLEARKPERRGTLAWIGTIGIVGWTVTLPMLVGTALGRWIDSRGEGKYSFTIMLMIGGLLLGCAAAWTWVTRRTGMGGRRKGR